MQWPEDTIREIAYHLDDAALAKLAETHGLWTLITRLYKDNDFWIHRTKNALGRGSLSNLDPNTDWKSVYYLVPQILDNLQQPGSNDLWSDFYNLGMTNGGVLQVLLNIEGPVDDPGPTTVEHLLKIKSPSVMKYLYEKDYIKLDNAMILKYLDIALDRIASNSEATDTDRKVLIYVASLLTPSNLLNGSKKNVLNRAIRNRNYGVVKEIIPHIKFDKESLTDALERYRNDIYHLDTTLSASGLRLLLSNPIYVPSSLYDRLLTYILVQRPSDVELLDTMIDWHEPLFAIAADRVLSDVVVDDDALIYQVLLTSLRYKNITWEDLAKEFQGYMYANTTILTQRLVEVQRMNRQEL